MPLNVISFVLGCAAICLADPGAIPSGPIPEQFGVNIHFTEGRPGEMDMLATAGFRWVRMDFAWNGTERQQGKYDFSNYDALIAELEKSHARAVFILDYSNPMYDQGLSPYTEAGRAAFATWAAAAVRHFKGHGILWEMYNEPNGGFWKPKANVDEYAKLAMAVGKALRDAEPGETYIGPATSGVDHKFIEACFKAGCLEYWSAVSVHPYRQIDPESAAKDYQTLRTLIAKYAPAGKHIPILSGEWGYSSVWTNYSEERQGKYLPREMLCDLWQEVPLSIWYDWHDDGTDPKEPEHHFGTVGHAYLKNRQPVYEPKPAYLAMKTLTAQLEGFRYNKRLALGTPDDFVLLFDRAGKPDSSRKESNGATDVRLAVWTIAKTPHSVTIPASPGTFTAFDYKGDPLPPLTAEGNGINVMPSDGVQYLTPEKPNKLLESAAAWERAPLEIRVHAPATVKLGNGNPNLQVDRSPEPIPVRIVCPAQGAESFVQETVVTVSNPLGITLQPRAGKAISVSVQNPSGEAFAGRVLLMDLKGARVESNDQPVNFKDGQVEAIVRFPLDREASGTLQAAAKVVQDGNVVMQMAAAEFTPMADFAKDSKDGHTTEFRTYADGNGKVAGETQLSVASPSQGPPEPGMGCLKLNCTFAPGWKFLEMVPTKSEAKSIDGTPKAYGLWVYGDGQGGATRIRYTDSTGQTFQSAGESITFTGWRYLTFSMMGNIPSTSRWGGANDGVVHYPIRWDSIFLLDKAEPNKSFESQVYLSGPTLVR
jgi:hypothetical protein